MRFEFSPDVSSVSSVSSDKNTEELLGILRRLQRRIGSEKQRIDPVCKEWDRIKRRLHDYEYVYTSANLTNNVSHISPISRSYFKMKEMYQEFNLQCTQEQVVCLAEAPGGFIQCLLEREIAQIHGITLISSDHKTPYWNRILFREPRVTFHEGLSGDGDLYKLRNILGFIKDIGKQSAYLVTGDGGFDNSEDYNQQEANSLRLIYSEIYLALHVQKIGGCFICKLFDTFETGTISLLYLLSLCYETCSFYKPCLSRISNSEKYVICQGFKGYDISLMNHMTHHFEDNRMDLEIPAAFYQKICDFTSDYGDQQIMSIGQGLAMIRERDFSREPTEYQLEIAKEWCHTYDVPVNMSCRYLR